jgi:hypothetical protein
MNRTTEEALVQLRTRSLDSGGGGGGVAHLLRVLCPFLRIQEAKTAAFIHLIVNMRGAFRLLTASKQNFLCI